MISARRRARCTGARAGAAGRCCCCTAIRRRTRCGTGWRRRWPSTSASSRWTCAAMATPAGPSRRRGSRAYSKREMALDALARDGARWASSASACWRTTAARASRIGSPLDHPAAVDRLMLLDIAPTLAMYEQHDRGLRARLLALVLPDPAAAAARGADRVRPGALRAQRDGPPPRRPGGVRARGAGRVRTLRRHAGHGAARSARTTAPAPASTSSTTAPTSRAGRLLDMPAARAVGRAWRRSARCFDVLGALARARAATSRGRALPCGHYIAEEAPAASAARSPCIFQGRLTP